MSNQNSHGNFPFKIIVIMKNDGVQDSKHMEIISYEEKLAASIALNALLDARIANNLKIIPLF